MTTAQPLVHLVTDNEVKGQAKELFEQMKAKTGKVPKWMRVMAHCENILIGFFRLFQATMDDTPVDKKLKWKVAYAVSEKNKCEFCVSVSKMQLNAMGMTDEDIENIKDGLTDKERIAMKYADASACHAYNIDPALIDEMKQHFSDEQIVEITSVVGLFSFINRFNDSLGVLPDV